MEAGLLGEFDADRCTMGWPTIVMFGAGDLKFSQANKNRDTCFELVARCLWPCNSFLSFRYKAQTSSLRLNLKDSDQCQAGD